MYPYEVKIPVVIKTGSNASESDPYHYGVTWKVKVTACGVGNINLFSVVVSTTDQLGYHFVMNKAIVDGGVVSPVVVGEEMVLHSGYGTWLPLGAVHFGKTYHVIISVNGATLDPKGKDPSSCLRLFRARPFLGDKLTDCLLECKGAKFAAHICVIGRESPVLLSAMKLKQDGISHVVIDGCEPTVLQVFLTTLYDFSFMDSCAQYYLGWVPLLDASLFFPLRCVVCVSIYYVHIYGQAPRMYPGFFVSERVERVLGKNRYIFFR